MRILHILDHSLPLQSGYAFRSLNIFRAQRRNGWETFHLTTPKQGSTDREHDHIDGWDFFRTPQRQAFNAPVVNELSLMRTTARRLGDLVRELKPDLIHAHSPLLNGYPALWVARRHGLPVVYEVRAFWEDAAVDHGTTTEGSLRYRATRSLESRLFARVDLVTAICNGLRTDIIQRGIDPAKVVIAPNVVDDDEFKLNRSVNNSLRKKLGLDGKIIFGFVGSFYAYEGLIRLIEVMPSLMQRHADIALLLVGGGPEHEAVARQIKVLGLEANVILTGRVPHAEVSDYYDLIDAFIYPRLPIRLTDLVTPLKPLEAMAARRLVIASDVGGHRELIRDGVTGFLFGASDPSDLLSGLDHALAQRSSWPGITERALAFVRSERSLDRLARAYKRSFANLPMRSFRGSELELSS